MITLLSLAVPCRRAVRGKWFYLASKQVSAKVDLSVPGLLADVVYLVTRRVSLKLVVVNLALRVTLYIFAVLLASLLNVTNISIATTILLTGNFERGWCVA